MARPKKPHPYDVLRDPKATTKQLRDAAVALGQEREDIAVPLLIQILRSNRNVGLSKEVVIALGRMKAADAVETLLAKLDTEQDRDLRCQIIQSLWIIGDQKAVPPLIQILQKDPNTLIRYTAAEALGRLKDASAIQPLFDALNDSHYRVHFAASDALGQLGQQYTEVIDLLTPILQAKKRPIKPTVYVMRAFGKINHPRVIDALIEVLNEGTKRVPPRTDFKDSTQQYHYQNRQLQDASVRRMAAAILGEFRDKRAIEPLNQRLNDPNEHPSLRPVIIKALEQLGEDTSHFQNA
jgi:HEAT repeat protein